MERPEELAMCVGLVRQSSCLAEAEEIIQEVEDGTLGVPVIWGTLLCEEADRKFKPWRDW